MDGAISIYRMPMLRIHPARICHWQFDTLISENSAQPLSILHITITITSRKREAVFTTTKWFTNDKKIRLSFIDFNWMKTIEGMKNPDANHRERTLILKMEIYFVVFGAWAMRQANYSQRYPRYHVNIATNLSHIKMQETIHFGLLVRTNFFAFSITPSPRMYKIRLCPIMRNGQITAAEKRTGVDSAKYLTLISYR